MPAGKLKTKSVERNTLADQVYTFLKKGIINGDLQPGERLKELEIAQSLGASRTPVREALSRLEQEGLVQPFPSGGLTVVKLSANDVKEIYGLLRVLESYGIRLAAERVTSKQLDRLEALCVRAEQLGAEEIDRLIELNGRFHELLIEVTAHRRLKELVGELRTALQPYRIVTMLRPDFHGSPQFRNLMVHQHSEIVRALRAREVDRLVDLVVEHNELGERTTLSHVWD
ncbi:MAG: GntR family transcriptional regulator [Vicinamibacteria bacterium]